MAQTGNQQGRMVGRVALGLIGALAGAAYWFALEILPDLLTAAPLYLFVSALVGGYFGALMALTGPMRLGCAVVWAVAPALVSAAMLTWASLRFETLAGFFARPEPLVAYLILLVLPLPFLIAARREGTHWRDYPILFGESWGIVVRLSTAGLFALIVWLVIVLSDELLQLVEIDLIERMIAVDWVPATLTGLIVGLALGLVNEMRDQVSPGLVLRLLRLLVPPALLVVGAFALAVPMRGLDALFGILSPAVTLLVIAFLLITLVSAAVDADDDCAVRSGAMRWATRGLSLLIPIVAALALEALRRRYGGDGLSPARLAGFVAGGVLFTYGLLYALSALSGAKWAARIRSANAWMALVVIALAALWLSPVLNAERISAANQVARFRSGAAPVDTLDLWTLRNDWGRAGQAALARIEAAADGHPEEVALRDRLALSAQAPDRFAFENVPRDPVSLNARAELKQAMPVQPPEAAAEFDRYVLPWYAGSVDSFLDGCRDTTASGRPGCVLIVADLVPDNPGNEAILFYKSFGLLRGEVIVPEPVFRRADAADVFSIPPADFEETDELIEQLQDGQFRAEPARINAISIGERQFTLPF